MSVPQVDTIPWSELLSIAASLVSIALGGFAIWLSLYLYKRSSEFSTKIKGSADRIGASIDRLETLFDKLYSDTFSMMKDTVSDMRKHAWREEPSNGEQIALEAERRADEKVKGIEEQFSRDLSDVLKRQAIAETRVTELAGKIGPVVRRVIAESRKAEVEAREETVRDHIRRAYNEAIAAGEKPTAELIVSRVEGVFPVAQVIGEIFNMGKEGLVSWPSAPGSLNPTSILKFK